MKSKLGHKEQEIMDFLHENVFDPILASPRASVKLKQGVRLTITRLEQLDATGTRLKELSGVRGSLRLCAKKGSSVLRKQLTNFVSGLIPSR
jgi:hypothetical protein